MYLAYFAVDVSLYNTAGFINVFIFVRIKAIIDYSVPPLVISRPALQVKFIINDVISHIVYHLQKLHWR